MQDSTFVLKSMGCKSNQFEGALIIQHLVESGYSQVKNVIDAGYYILNSCSVTHKSDNETLYLLRNAKNTNPDVKTVITGCVAQIEKEKLLELPYIDYVFGNDDKFRISELLKSGKKSQITDLINKESFNYQVLGDTAKTRYSLKIQDGCNSRCAYCIIPFARGKSRSADSEFIVSQINNAVKKGFKEVVFTGIHIGQWGMENGRELTELLRKVEEETCIRRYRLGSLNPLEITGKLLNFLEKSDRFCPHFHLSLQSACNKTLKSMNRFYKTEDYLEQIEDIKSRFDGVFIGSDIIAGFAGESEEDFLETVDNLNKSKLSKIHTFPYSIRHGTPAEKMDGHIPEEIKQKRADIIKEISARKFKEFLCQNIGTVHEVLIEKHPDKYSGKLKGVSENYINVIIDEDTKNKSLYYNTLQKVHLDRISSGNFYGSFI
ncbi:MAG: tRNA (N(6)-L-threonylcarbamoyladenosine(37)-C(2))-methylthiotransferase MtaB [Candidatus Gastranaerophilales bacterium]|nr:tRNA (N(6)-L-threonylcarbamoyladenosine(37)-C(2))-methylthiotransferase MtaB [Candidatus Gastranaerophilales bacterium]